MAIPNILGDYKDAINSVAANLKSYASPTPDRLQRPKPPTLNATTLPYQMQPRQTRGPLATPFLSQAVGNNTGYKNRFSGKKSGFGFRSTSANAPLYALGSALGQQFSLLSGTKPTAPPPGQTGGSGVVDYSGRLAGTQPYTEVMKRVSTESGVPWEVLMAIMGLESSGQNLDPNGAGAMGLMQVVPLYWQDTANKYGGNLMDPYTNIRTAADILLQNYNTYGSWEKAAAAYFGGGGAFNPDGSYSGASDSNGTDIQTYVNVFLQLLQQTGYGQPSSAEIWNDGNAANPTASHAIAAAQQAIGTPYVWAGQEPGGFDCSGLMMWAYAQAGKQIARTAEEQYNTTQRINSDDLMPGDLIFFSDTDGSGRAVTHVGMYLGNGQMLHAPKEGDVVKIVSINNDYWQSHLYGFGRVV